MPRPHKMKTVELEFTSELAYVIKPKHLEIWPPRFPEAMMGCLQALG